VILLIDHYDSFTHNLVHLLAGAGAHLRVVRCDEFHPDEIEAAKIHGIVLSPGPGAPGERGVGMEVIRRFAGLIPVLGVCLGMEMLAKAHGAQVVRAAEPRHGKTSRIEHRGAGLFAGVPNPCSVMRYHSLIVERSTLPRELVCDATVVGDPTTVMGLSCPEQKQYGVQFHPESFLSEHGPQMASNFLRLCGENHA
jgi:anthranilate synthase component 2